MMTQLALVFLAASGDIAPPVLAAGNEELNAYLIEAAENHPRLEARFEEWEAALMRVPQVRSLDDPTLSYGQFLQSEIQRAMVTVGQKFPWFGTLRARGDKATAEAEAALNKFYAERDALFFNVKDAYFEYAYLAEAIHLVEAQMQVLDYVADVVESKLALGLATDDEMLRVTIARTELTDRRDGLLSMRRGVSARLSAAAGREPAGLLPWPGEVGRPVKPPDQQAVFGRIRTANPSLHVFESRIDAMRVQRELAKKKGWPDFTVSAQYVSISKPRKVRPDRPYPATLNAVERLRSGSLSSLTSRVSALDQLLAGGMPRLSALRPAAPVTSPIDAYTLATANEPMAYSDGGEDNIMLSVSVNVPIWRKKIRAGVAEAKHKEQAVRHERRGRLLELQTAAAEALAQCHDAARRARLYDDSLLPQAQMTFESLQEKYAADAAGKTFLDIMESVERLLRFELEKARALRDWRQTTAEIEWYQAGPVEHAPRAQQAPSGQEPATPPE